MNPLFLFAALSEHTTDSAEAFLSWMFYCVTFSTDSCIVCDITIFDKCALAKIYFLSVLASVYFISPSETEKFNSTTAINKYIYKNKI